MRNIMMGIGFLLMSCCGFAAEPSMSPVAATSVNLPSVTVLATPAAVQAVSPALKPMPSESKPASQDLQKKLLRNFVGLMVVLAVLFVLVTMYKRTALYKNFHHQPLKIVLSMSIAPKQKLVVVEMLGGYSVLAITDKNINLIQVLQPDQIAVLQDYLARKAASQVGLLSKKNASAAINLEEQSAKTGFDKLLKKILNNNGSSS